MEGRDEGQSQVMPSGRHAALHLPAAIVIHPALVARHVRETGPEMGMPGRDTGFTVNRTEWSRASSKET